MRINCNTDAFTPIGKKLVVDLEVQDKIGSILLSRSHKTTTGTVLCCGPECSEVKKGDKVMLGQFKGTEYEFDDGEFTMCFEEHVIAVYE
jgi:co-chaperonin GroES (HSP10)